MGSKKQSAPQRYHHGDLKRAIMTAALEMTEESGFASLSLREIARRIGVTTAAPYHHFKDRQSLLMELAIEGYSLLLLALQKSRESTGNPEQELCASAAAYLEFGRKHRALYSVMFSGELATHPRMGELSAVADPCLELVRQSIADGSALGKQDSAEAAFCAWSLLHGILMLDNGVLQESHAEQRRLGIRGVLAIAKGMQERFTSQPAPMPSPKQLSQVTKTPSEE